MPDIPDPKEFYEEHKDDYLAMLRHKLKLKDLVEIVRTQIEDNE